MAIRDAINTRLDQLVGPELRLRNRGWSAFHVCGYTGLALAVALSMILVTHRGLSPWVMGGVVVSAVASFFALALLTKIITGKEDLVYYRHEIAAVLVATGFLRLIHQPILAYLDPTILGVGTFLVCGRVGCLMVGCCHGRPYNFGVRYRAEHATNGFPSCLVGVRLFPIQLVESVFVFGIVAVGTVLVWRGEPPGTGLATYVTAYAVGRFCFEFLRGDRERPYIGGFSEAQWSSVLLLGVVAVAEGAGALPGEPWHAPVLPGLVLAAVVVAARRLSRLADDAVLRPDHLIEVAEALDWAARRPARVGGVEVWQTSFGLRISGATIETDRERIQQYTLSRENGLTADSARALARLIARLRHPVSSTELIQGNQDVFHVLVRPAT
jgi:Prolipoprotein diacylglyceryl transferase